MKRKYTNFEIGDLVKDKFSIMRKRRVGEITSINDHFFECIQINPKTLEVTFGLQLEPKRFKVKKDAVKKFTPVKELLRRNAFDLGTYVEFFRKKHPSHKKYGMIIGYLNEEEGLYPHSYDMGHHNGKDLLECIEVEPRKGLPRILHGNGSPKKFVASADLCKSLMVLDVDENGNHQTSFKLA
jgi:hypothetical protein